MSTQWSVARPLPAPHDRIVCSFKWLPDGICAVEYITDSLEALHEAGGIDADTLRLYTTTRKRIADVGNGGGFVTRDRLYRPLRWRVTISYAEKDFALGLPGVKLPGVSEQVEQVTGTGDSTVQRARCVGRLQRPVRWSVIESKLIVVDWRAVQAAAISQRVYT